MKETLEYLAIGGLVGVVIVLAAVKFALRRSEDEQPIAIELDRVDDLKAGDVVHVALRSGSEYLIAVASNSDGWIWITTADNDFAYSHRFANGAIDAGSAVLTLLPPD